MIKEPQLTHNTEPGAPDWEREAVFWRRASRQYVTDISHLRAELDARDQRIDALVQELAHVRNLVP